MTNLLIVEFLYKDNNKKYSRKEIKMKLFNWSNNEYTSKYKIFFSYMLSNKRKLLNATSIVPFSILFNYSWTNAIVNNYDKNEVLKIAFIQTLGHEISHKLCDKFFVCKNRQERIFHKWTREIYNDFYGCKLCNDSSKDKVITSCRYKEQYRTKNSCVSYNCNSHPSWEKRIEYIKMGVFDEKLIYQIAKDTGCNNKILIHKVCEHYKRIELK